jgi:hypothetical protein
MRGARFGATMAGTTPFPELPVSFPLSIRRWRAGHLLASWCAYWGALLLGALGPAALAVWRVSQRVTGKNAMGVTASIENGLARLVVTEHGAPAWTGQASLSTIALAIAVPPLVLWVGWLVTRRRPARADRSPLGAPPTDAALGAPSPWDADPRWPERTREPVSRERRS